MNIKRVLLVLALALLLAGGYLFLHRDTAKAPSQQQPDNTQPTDQTNNDPPVEQKFDKNKYSRDDVTSIWVVVNKQRPLSPKTFAPTDLVAVGGGQQLRKEAAAALVQLISAAKTDGKYISPLSGYRSYNTQVTVYNREVSTYGQTVADSQSARPGTSEHQTGLSIDVGGGGCGVEDCFGKTAEGKWVAANAYKYGFIIRYPETKQPITGYRYEPWHIRYVGVELATEMQKQGVQTLEEFFSLPAAPSYN